MLDLVRRVYPDTPAVFIDTGLEYPEIRDFVKTIPNVTWLKPEMNFKKVIETYGYPLISKEVSQKIYEARNCPNGVCASRFENNNEHNLKYGNRYSMAKWKPLRDSNIPISHKCCDVMKKKPAKAFEKKTGMKPIVATMACESQNRRTAWLRHGCNAFESKRPISQPMSFWTEQDVLEYIKIFMQPTIEVLWEQAQFSHGTIRRKARKQLKKINYIRYAYASVYGEILQDDKGKYYTTGCDRTGCVFCGFGCHLEKEQNRFQRLKVTHPKLWDYCMRDWSEGGLGMRSVLEYIGVKVE